MKFIVNKIASNFLEQIEIVDYDGVLKKVYFPKHP